MAYKACPARSRVGKRRLERGGRCAENAGAEEGCSGRARGGDEGEGKGMLPRCGQVRSSLSGSCKRRVWHPGAPAAECGSAVYVPNVSLEFSATCCPGAVLCLSMVTVSLIPCFLQTATLCAASAWPTCGTRAAPAWSARTPGTCSWGITAFPTARPATTRRTAPAEVSSPWTCPE